MTSSRTVIFVGRRRRALEAAAALGLEVICVDEAAPRSRKTASLISRFVACSLAAGTDWQRVGRGIPGAAAAGAVFALTERAVVPAARLRRALDLPGDPPSAAVRCTDKLEMKRAIAAAGLPCARFVDAERGLAADELVAELGLPMVAKARVGSGGRGQRLWLTAGEVARLDPGWMAESFVDGTEMSVESLVSRGRVSFVNLTEYFRVRWANIAPAVLPADVARRVEDLHARAVAALGVDTGVTHMELFLTAAGPVFSELAARPPGGHISELLARAYGFDFWQTWLRQGLGEDVGPLPPPRRAAGVWLLHPGPGTVRRISGVDAARTLPGVESVTLRLRPGATVEERLGSGQEAGHLIVTGGDRDEVARRLVAAYETIRIEMGPPETA